jgi:molecular chaperone DnaK (HSP70)
MVEDVTGKQLKAKTVLTLTIKYLKDDIIRHMRKRCTDVVRNDLIRWVFTVPAIWNDAAKQFMTDVIVEVFQFSCSYNKKRK